MLKFLRTAACEFLVLRLTRARRNPGINNRRPALEALEERLSPATLAWARKGGDTNWSTPANWNPKRAPVSGDVVILPRNSDSQDDISGLTLAGLSADTAKLTFKTNLAIKGSKEERENVFYFVGGYLEMGKYNLTIDNHDNTREGCRIGDLKNNTLIAASNADLSGNQGVIMLTGKGSQLLLAGGIEDYDTPMLFRVQLKVQPGATLSISRNVSLENGTTILNQGTMQAASDSVVLTDKGIGAKPQVKNQGTLLVQYGNAVALPANMIFNVAFSSMPRSGARPVKIRI